jgi:hypothetical protein
MPEVKPGTRIYWRTWEYETKIQPFKAQIIQKKVLNAAAEEVPPEPGNAAAQEPR